MKQCIRAAVATVLLGILIGCDAHQGLINAERQYPNNEIVVIPGTRSYIMRTPNGEIWYATNDGMGPREPTYAAKLLNAK